MGVAAAPLRSRRALGLGALGLGALLLSGCSLFDSGEIERARLTRVTVEALPLRDERRPDLYVDLKNLDLEGDRWPFAGSTTVARTVLRPAVRGDELPLDLAVSRTNGWVPIGAPVRFTVNDSTSTGFADPDDLLVATDTLRFLDYVQSGDARGDEREVTLGTADTRLRVRVRWE